MHPFCRALSKGFPASTATLAGLVSCELLSREADAVAEHRRLRGVEAGLGLAAILELVDRREAAVEEAAGLGPRAQFGAQLAGRGGVELAVGDHHAITAR